MLMKGRKKNFLNKGTELFTNCRHVTKRDVTLLVVIANIKAAAEFDTSV